jgi:hypothetical protein
VSRDASHVFAVTNVFLAVSNPIDAQQTRHAKKPVRAPIFAVAGSLAAIGPFDRINRHRRRGTALSQKRSNGRIPERALRG